MHHVVNTHTEAGCTSCSSMPGQAWRCSSELLVMQLVSSLAPACLDILRQRLVRSGSELRMMQAGEASAGCRLAEDGLKARGVHVPIPPTPPEAADARFDVSRERQRRPASLLMKSVVVELGGGDQD